MGMIEVFRDDFTAGTLLQQFTGNGSFAFPGTVAQLTCPNSQNCTWTYDWPLAPVLWRNLTGLGQLAQPIMPVRVQTKLNSFTRTTNSVGAGLCLFVQPAQYNRAYLLAYYPADSKVHIWVNYYGGTTLDLATAVAAPDPNTTPHLYRIYWNPGTRGLYVQEIGTLLAPGYAAFACSFDDGATWTKLASVLYGPNNPTYPIYFSKAGVFARKWVAGAGDNCTAEFEYLVSEQYDADNLLLIPDAWGRHQEKISLEDVPSFPTSGGEPRWDVPGLDHDLHLRTEAVGLEDPLTFPEGGTDKPRWDLPDVMQEKIIRGETIGLEGQLLAGFAEDLADFYVKQEDGDGKVVLYDGGVLDVLHIDTTVGGFGDPTSNNHWGAAADGKLYADGVECGPGDFGTLAGGHRHAAWRRTNLDPLAFKTSTQSMALIADDTYRLSGTFSAWGANTLSLASHLCWVLTGDFDIQVDFANIASVVGTQWTVTFGLVANAGPSENQFYFYRYGGGYYEAAVLINGGWGGLGTVGTSDLSGKLRITRSAGVFQAYYWTGSDWATVGTTYSHANLSGDLYVGIWLDGNASHGCSVDFSGFTINSGSTSNRAGWYREAAGSHRGALQAAPASMLAVATNTSVDLFDEATGKMWMRFLLATNNVLNGDGSQKERPRKLAWRDGSLLIGFGNSPDDTERGAGIDVDFTMDSVRWHRESGASETGGYYWRPLERATGVIQYRNSAKGYSGDDDNWRIPDYRVWCVDLWDDSGYEYRAFATVAGVAVAKWQRWYLINTPYLGYAFSTEVDRPIFCKFKASNGQLFYIDRPANVGAGFTRPPSKLYSALKATWEAGISGGTWSADTSKELPGTRAQLNQFAVEFDPSSTTIWMPANEGIYAIDWPSGSWSLLYGIAHSGATHEILPDCGLVATLRYHLEGATPLLIVGLDRPARTVAINLTTNTIYWRSKVRRGPAPVALALKA